MQYVPPAESNKRIKSKIDLNSIQDDTEASQKAIDDEISQLQAKIIMLRIRRNTSAPIHKVLQGVLTEIFLWVQSAEYVTTPAVGISGKIISGESISVDSEHWKKILHVCSYWNNIASNYPALWSTINVSSTGWEGGLVRSQSVPLTIRAFATRDFETAIGGMEQHLHRLREVDMVFHPAKMQENFSELEKLQPAYLESVSLQSSFSED